MADYKSILDEYFKHFEKSTRSIDGIKYSHNNYDIFISTGNNNAYSNYIVLFEMFSSKPVVISTKDISIYSLSEIIKKECTVIYKIREALVRQHTIKDLLKNV